MHFFSFDRSFKEEKEESKKQVRTSSGINDYSPKCENYQQSDFICIVRKKKELSKQTDPPSIPILDLFPSGDFPEGEIQQYKDE